MQLIWTSESGSVPPHPSVHHHSAVCVCIYVRLTEVDEGTQGTLEGDQVMWPQQLHQVGVDLILHQQFPVSACVGDFLEYIYWEREINTHTNSNMSSHLSALWAGLLKKCDLVRCGYLVLERHEDSPTVREIQLEWVRCGCGLVARAACPHLSAAASESSDHCVTHLTRHHPFQLCTPTFEMIWRWAKLLSAIPSLLVATTWGNRRGRICINYNRCRVKGWLPVRSQACSPSGTVDRHHTTQHAPIYFIFHRVVML